MALLLQRHGNTTAEGKLICVQTSNYTPSALVDDDVGLFLSQSHMKLPTNYQN